MHYNRIPMQNPHIFMKVPRVSGWGAWGGRLKKNLTNLAKKKKNTCRLGDKSKQDLD